tara:strand:- start:125 stop:589 length:465 start_codon:yes stop_codon:yes gene_type:complete
MNILDNDVIYNIFGFINKHSYLGLLTLVNKDFKNKSEKKIELLYKKEENIIRTIITKIRMNLTYNEYDIFSKCKSIEHIKYLFKWDNNDNSHIYFNFENGMNNYHIIDIFYCDCNWCHRTEICGKGLTITLNSEEKNLLKIHFQYDWWNRIYEI